MDGPGHIFRVPSWTASILQGWGGSQFTMLFTKASMHDAFTMLFTKASMHDAFWYTFFRNFSRASSKLTVACKNLCRITFSTNTTTSSSCFLKKTRAETVSNSPFPSGR